MEITKILDEWSKGDRQALEKLLPIVYDELHRLARYHLSRERAHHTLQTTALVNELYLQLVRQRQVRFQNRAHFFAIAAQLMRRVLIDYARRRHTSGGGSDKRRITIETLLLPERQSDVDVVALDRALKELSEIDPRQSSIVEMRFFAGLTIEEVSHVLKISPITVRRDWTVARAWLYRKIFGEGA